MQTCHGSGQVQMFQSTALNAKNALEDAKVNECWCVDDRVRNSELQLGQVRVRKVDSVWRFQLCKLLAFMNQAKNNHTQVKLEKF